MDIDAIVKYRRPKESFYDILGCHHSSTIDQINREYRIKALQLHPDKNPDPESAQKFQQLQIAKDILSDINKRKSYDTWLNSGLQIPFEQWEKRKGHSMHWAPPRNMKLSIQETNSPRQDGGGGDLRGDSLLDTQGNSSSLLQKFRRYEI